MVNIIYIESYLLCGKGKYMIILSKNVRKLYFYFFFLKYCISNKCVFDVKVFSEIYFFFYFRMFIKM